MDFFWCYLIPTLELLVGLLKLPREQQSPELGARADNALIP